MTGFLFACHGADSLFGLLGSTKNIPFATWPSWWAAAIQLVGGILVMLGLFTRVAAVICSGSMAYAYFVVHQKTGFLPMQNKGELSALYAWIFLTIAFIGPGPVSLDRLFRRGPATVPTRDLSPAAA